jgi:uncharacterized membrane protein YsdA (DUF1294 family)
MPILTLVAAASFACINPAHVDGVSIRCDQHGIVMQLEGIAAPSIAAPCRRFTNCRVDPGTASRDHLAELTRGQIVICSNSTDKREHSTRCTVQGVDLSCAMVRDGFAVNTDGFADKTVGSLGCETAAKAGAAQSNTTLANGARSFIELPMLWRWVPLYFMLINFITYLVFAIDKRRTKIGLYQMSEAHLLSLVVFGGGIGAIVAQQRLDHMRENQSFGNKIAILIGLQIGAIIGVIGFSLF